ncbi:hypothetical protein KCP73_04975 [Salmonella enterica subsp. enterica]|nr:hypothetical protein KCP73_04975 [Salmonella enterica subsp. enterica]
MPSPVDGRWLAFLIFEAISDVTSRCSGRWRMSELTRTDALYREVRHWRARHGSD